MLLSVLRQAWHDLVTPLPAPSEVLAPPNYERAKRRLMEIHQVNEVRFLQRKVVFDQGRFEWAEVVARTLDDNPVARVKPKDPMVIWDREQFQEFPASVIETTIDQTPTGPMLVCRLTLEATESSTRHRVPHLSSLAAHPA